MLALLCLGVLAGPVSAVHAAVLPPSLDESASPAAIQVGDTTTLGFTVSNFNDSGPPLSEIGFTETLPAGLQIVQLNGAGDCSGTGTATADTETGTISLSGAILVSGGQCFFSVKVKATTAGTKVATSGAITATESGPGSTASATIDILGPPSLATSFGAPSVLLNATTTLSYTITNSNGVDQTGVAFTDALPMGLTITTPNNFSGSCGAGATIIAAAGSSSVSLAGGTVDPNSSCTFSVTVIAGAAGTLVNTTSAVSSSNGGTGATATASLLVVLAPTLSTSFGVASMTVGATTSATFTIHNPNSTTALSGVGVSDSLPAGLVVATPNGQTGSCGGGTITATAGSSTISLSGATLAANASCSFSVNVTGATLGTKSNTTGPVTSTESGDGATASASVGVVGPPTIAASFGAASIARDDTTTLSFTVTNPAANPSLLHGVGFSDSLPAGLVVATPNGQSGSCGGGTISATAGSSTVSLSAATLSLSQTCSFSVDVLATTVGTKNNVTGQVTSTEGGNGGTASATVDVSLAPSLDMAFTPASIAVGGTTTLGYTITNPTANSAALTGVGFTDALPSGLVVTTPNGLSGSCGGGAIDATAGSSTVSLTGATVAAHGSCTFSVTVTASVLGTLPNTTSTVTSSNAGTGAAASASLLVLQVATLSMEFGAGSIGTGNPTSATFTIVNPNPGTALTGLGVSDTLPAGLVVASPNGATGDCGGTITATAGSSTISLSGGTVAENTSCSFSVNVAGTTPGVKSTTTGPVSSTESGPGGTAGASVTVFAPPTIATSFSAASVGAGATATLSFTITNPAANPGTLNGVGVYDPLPAGLVVATPNGATGDCGGTITATAGSPDVNLSGATLDPSQHCSFSVTVLATGSGPQDNVTGFVTSTEGGDGATASATIDVPQAPAIQIAFADASISVSALTTLSFTLTNPNPIALTGVAFTDTLPAGMALVILKPLSGACGGGTITVAPGNGSLALTGGNLAAHGSCTFSVIVTGSTVGVKDNVTSSVDSTEAGTGAPSGARLIVTAAPRITPPPPSTTPSTTPPPSTNKTTKAPCVVPRLTGKTLAQAKKLLSHAHCKLGKVTRKRVHAAKVRRITRQTPKAGSKRSAGTRVSVTVAK